MRCVLRFKGLYTYGQRVVGSARLELWKDRDLRPQPSFGWFGDYWDGDRPPAPPAKLVILLPPPPTFHHATAARM